jgi:hypothetical protein
VALTRVRKNDDIRFLLRRDDTGHNDAVFAKISRLRLDPKTAEFYERLPRVD